MNLSQIFDTQGHQFVFFLKNFCALLYHFSCMWSVQEKTESEHENMLVGLSKFYDLRP